VTSHRSNGLYRLLERAALYERFQKLLGADAARRRFVRDFLRPFPGARLLDIGCGTGSLLDYLPFEVEYVGFDLNARYIEAARKQYGSRGRFHCAAVGTEPVTIEEGPFDFVVAKSLLHHLTDEQARQLVATARRCLRTGGVFVSSDNVFFEGQRRVARWLTELDRGGCVRSPEGYRALVEPHFAEVETRLVHDLVAFPYDHFIMRARVP
jgi:SAM-dependent methyltransferase